MVGGGEGAVGSPDLATSILQALKGLLQKKHMLVAETIICVEIAVWT